MYHLSSSSLRNLFTTGDPIWALSHEFEGPKSNTKPLEDEEAAAAAEERDSFEAGATESSGFELEFESELGPTVEFLSVVSGLVEHRVR